MPELVSKSQIRRLPCKQSQRQFVKNLIRNWGGGKFEYERVGRTRPSGTRREGERAGEKESERAIGG